MRCLGCSYNLEGLPENRCPECGRPFDPDDPSTFLARAPSGKRHLLAAVVSGIATAVGPVLAKMQDLEVFAMTDLGFVGTVVTIVCPCLIVGGWVAAVQVFRTSAGVLSHKYGQVDQRAAFVGALVVSTVIVVGWVIALLASALVRLI
ncbi:MAG: hypothetical protein ACYSUI_17765 [Planctomycetota bacterium]